MNSKKITAIIILLAMLVMVPLQQINVKTTTADLPELPDNSLTPDSELVIVTKKIVAANGSLLEFYRTSLEETFTVIIEVQNTAVEAIYNVTLTAIEADLTQNSPSYDPSDFEIQGDLELNESVILAGQAKSISFSVTPLATGTYTFNQANASYAWGDTTEDFSLSNDIEFIVYEESESIRLEKFFVISGEDQITARAKRNTTIQIKIIITNFYYKPANISISDSDPGEFFEGYFPENLTKEGIYLDIGESSSYIYDVKPILEEEVNLATYIVGRCNATAELSNGTIVPDEQSNTISLEVYRPIYDGDDWTQKVPMLSVKKYFRIQNEELEFEYVNKIEVYNDTSEPITIFINITNSGIVPAWDIVIYEEEYPEWVFETDGLRVWEISELEQNENLNFTYTITPIIVGTFKIEPTEIRYVYQNQENLLNETDQVIYSNMIEVSVDYFEPEISYSTQWWTAIGVSIGIVFLAVIPTVIAFITYSRRRKTQKGM